MRNLALLIVGVLLYVLLLNMLLAQAGVGGGNGARVP
jgi:hypothetical protein